MKRAKTTEPIGCSVCGNILKEDDIYVEKDETVICAHCAEELDLCDILDFLELRDVIELLDAATECVKIAR